MNILRRLVCLLNNHRFSSWKLRPYTFGDNFVIDVAHRSCTCCGTSQVSRLDNINGRLPASRRRSLRSYKSLKLS